MAAPAPADNGGDSLPVATGPRPIRGDVIEAYEAMIASVPDAGGDGFESILAAIALASAPSQLDAPWRSTGLAGFANTPLVVTGIRKMPSDFPGGLPWFLIIDAANLLTGEVVSITTGAVSVVAQLVKAWSLDAFPLRVVPRIAERPSANGYFPQHLEIVS